MNAPRPNATTHRLFQVHRKTASQAPAHETARAPAPTAAAQEQAARITESGMKADVFERVV
ncbi:hypothetical protein B1H19_01380 [Streptomyces gilvosporeus]|uniref:Uncharacterized protein n=2 Tax=Streptomyces gilvosporeus TaxID=553510 RepID=A0A1V0TJA0_9ACTN|nr:hypothetical protein B1H19_01380 [Streptomyces gilvosporeus]